MFPENNLYEAYKEKCIEKEFSSFFPDITKKITLQNINYAINLCVDWNASLDIGCGIGHYSGALSTKFKESDGVEIDVHQEQAELMKKNNNVKIYNSSIENFQNSKKYDFILLADIFEHIPDIKKFIQKIASFQEAGGIIYIMTPNPVVVGPAPKSAIFHTISSYHGHIKHYTKKEIEALMKEAGYEIEFLLYEETPARQEIKRIVRAVSRRDKTYSSYSFYRLIRPLTRPLGSVIFKFLERKGYKIELSNRHNEFCGRTLDITFKKTC